MYEVNGVKYDENINTSKTNTEQGWNTQEQYKQWEHETKELYEEQWQKCMNNGMGADADYISKLIQDVTKELKEINRMCEQLNGTGYGKKQNIIKQINKINHKAIYYI